MMKSILLLGNGLKTEGFRISVCKIKWTGEDEEATMHPEILAGLLMRTENQKRNWRRTIRRRLNNKMKICLLVGNRISKNLNPASRVKIKQTGV